MTVSRTDKERIAHLYQFRFECVRRPHRIQFVQIHHWGWRRALSLALTKLAERTNTSRAIWRLTMMEET